jgi:hypothetical protein
MAQMNERIRELAKVAEYWANTFEDKSRYQEYLMETFAELIIRECAGVGYDASYYECALNVSNKIKQHFGVEE